MSDCSQETIASLIYSFCLFSSTCLRRWKCLSESGRKTFRSEVAKRRSMPTLVSFVIFDELFPFFSIFFSRSVLIFHFSVDVDVDFDFAFITLGPRAGV